MTAKGPWLEDSMWTPDALPNEEYANAIYNVRLVYDYMVVFTVVTVPRDLTDDTETLIEKATDYAYDMLRDEYGVDFAQLKPIDIEVELEAVSR